MRKHGSRLFRRGIAAAMCALSLLLVTPVTAQAASNTLDIQLTPNANGYGSMSIAWPNYAYADKSFKVYRSKDGGKSFETVPIDYTQVKRVRCLQIYPIEDAKNQMRDWVVNSGYGKGIITVDSIPIETYNANPKGSLQDGNGNWKYDVIFFGTWDCNNGKDLNANSAAWTRKFMDAGRGAIFGHDTIVNNWFNHGNFRSLQNYAGVRIVDNAELYPSNKVIIQRNGLFTTYPNYIGEPGTVLTIPAAHTIGQVVSTGTSWLRFDSKGSQMANGEIAPSYLTTYNNVGMIQTGHSSGAATPDEQKILSNLIFYCNQLLFGDYHTKDNSAQDYAAPNAPKVSGDHRTFNVSALDNGSTYHYYVESFDKNDTSLSGRLARSATKAHSVTTGVKQYRYIFDDSANTTVTKTNGTATSSGKISGGYGKGYLHVAAVDGAGNIGPTTTMPVGYDLTLNANTGTGSYGPVEVKFNATSVSDMSKHKPSKTGYSLQGLFTSKTGGAKVYGADGRVVNEGTYFSGNRWVRKADTTLYAQWKPNTYTMTYDKNSPDDASVGDSDVTVSVPNTKSKYDSAWGSLATASKPGYLFDGWWTKPSGGTQVTKDTIVRGDITVYAHWKPITYTVRFLPNAENGAGTVTGSMASVKMTYDKVMSLPVNRFVKTTVTPAEDDGGETVVNDSKFMGWNRNARSLDIGYADKAQVMNLTKKNGDVIDLYAIWDDTPNFEFAEYPDRYFTLDEAQSGVITESELLNTVKVYDRESRELPKKTSADVANGDDFGVSIVGYDSEEFTSLTDDSTISVRYKVKDASGNTAYLNIVVTVSRNGALPIEDVEYYRSIDETYRGTLADVSRWNTDDTYNGALDDALSGRAKTYSLEVGGDELSEVRDYVDDNGFGNSGGNLLQQLFDALFK